MLWYDYNVKNKPFIGVTDMKFIYSSAKKAVALLLAAVMLCFACVVPASAEVIIDPSAADTALYKLSYSSLINRLSENGYAATSLTGKYKGMYVRDAAIQVMAMVANGDVESAGLMLEYIFTYHESTGYTYALCVLPQVENFEAEEIAAPISKRIQSDTTYMLLHAFVKWYEANTDEAARSLFLERHWGTMCAFADYFTTEEYYSKTRNLILNPNFQNIDRYYKCYDLITNVFASQAFYEMSEIATAKGDNEYADSWENAAYNLRDGINKNLVVESGKVKIYREMYDVQAKRYYNGFSFINFAPVAAEWFGTDYDLMANTYAQHMKQASSELDGVTLMDSRHIVGSARWSEEILGKHLAWEIMYLASQSDNSERLRELLDFMATHTPEGEPYAEAWVFDGSLADAGNQEQTAWLIYALATVMPRMRLNYTAEETVSSVPETSSTVSKTDDGTDKDEPDDSNRIITVLFIIIASAVALSIAVLAARNIHRSARKKARVAETQTDDIQGFDLNDEE